MIQWLQSHEATAWVFLISGLMFFGSLIVVPIVIARMQPDYFLPEPPPPASWRRRHPLIRYILRSLPRYINNIPKRSYCTSGIFCLRTRENILNRPVHRLQIRPNIQVIHHAHTLRST